MQVKGTVYKVTDTVQKTEKFSSRDLILETADNPSYPQFIKIEAGNAKCDLLDNIAVGSEVEVDFNLNGRKYVNKEGIEQYFNSLSLWKINVLSASTAKLQPVNVEVPAGQEDDDLPF